MAEHVERDVLAAAMWCRPDREVASRLLTPGMFLVKAHAAIYEAITALYDADPETLFTGEGFDAADTVAAQLRSSGQLGMAGGLEYLKELVAAHITTDVKRLCDLMMEQHARTELSAAVVKASELLRGEPEPSGPYGQVARHSPTELYAAVAAFVEQARPVPVNDLPITVQDLIDLGLEPPAWLIPRVLRRQDRLVIVAAEGIGKTMLVHQLALQISQGVHPFRTETVEPQPALIIDLENNPALRVENYERMLRVSQAQVPETFDPTRLSVQFPERSLDLAVKSDQLWLEGQIDAVRPAVVSLGPVYRLHIGDGKEQTIVRVLTDVIDRLRTTYNCAFLLEGHAPHDSFRSGKEHAPLRPTGSRAWIYWADMVKTIDYADGPRNGEVVEVGKARSDRESGRSWPFELRRGGDNEWPWERGQM